MIVLVGTFKQLKTNKQTPKLSKDENKQLGLTFRIAVLLEGWKTSDRLQAEQPHVPRMRTCPSIPSEINTVGIVTGL